MTRLAPSLALAAVALIGTAAIASAHDHSKPDTTHRAVCHPTGKGYVLINPAQASAHIDERTAAPKHEHDGRVDVYAINGACPPIATPTTIPTTATPSPTTTGSTPSTTTTTTSPSPTSSTSTSSSPTPSGPAVTTPSTTTSTTPATVPVTTSTSPTDTSSAPSPRTTNSALPSPASPRRSGPSSTVAPPELPRTGSSNAALAALGAVLLAAGIALSRKGARRGQH